ncbi:MAG: hypothetical protein RLZZ458_2065 [Planctomycetota bacterium]
MSYQPAVVTPDVNPHQGLRLFAAAAALLALCCAATAFPLPVRAQALTDEDVEQRGMLRRIGEIEESLRKEAWLEAVQRFDEAWGLVCQGEDPLLEQRGVEQRQLAPGESDVLAGGKARLEAVFRNAGPAFRTQYAEQFKEPAAQALRNALEQGDSAALARHAARFQWTPSGPLMLSLLARAHIDSGDFLEAALLLTRAAGLSQPVQPLLQLQAAWCFAKSGLLTDAAEILSRLRSGTVPMFAAGDVSGTALLRELDQLLAADISDPKPSAAWLQPFGDYRHLRTQTIASPRMQPAWSQNLFQLHDVLYSDRMNPLLAEIASRVEQRNEQFLDSGGIAAPVAQPLLSNGRAFVRTPFSIQAWDLTTSELIWEAARPTKSLRELADQLEGSTESDQQQMLSMLIDEADLAHGQSVRTPVGMQMTISGSTLFVVEETAASGNDWLEMPGMIRGMPTVPTNYIRAYDLDTGLFRWEIGGQAQNPIPGEPQRANLLAGYYFLGAPLVLGNRIYVLAENGTGIYLVRIGEPDLAAGRPNPQILASQSLAAPDVPLAQHPVRRLAGLMPAFAGGLLICPTCDGRLTALSADDLSIRWITRYAATVQAQEIGNNQRIILFGTQNALLSEEADNENRWCDFLPRVVGQRVFLTPRDSDQLYCLDLQTGRQLWAAPRGGYHSIAGVTAENIILAGRRQAGALKLESGEPAWTTMIPEGIVCGSGIFTGKLLQLPTTKPSLISIDVNDGRILAAQPWSGPVQPGNLLSLPEGMLLQGLTKLSWLPRVTKELLPTERAFQLVLEGKPAEARQILEQQLTQQPADATARLLLIDILLDELRLAAANESELVQRIQALLKETAAEGELGAVLHSLLGMTLPDAAGLPWVLRTDGRRREEKLREVLLQRQMSGSADASLDSELARLRQLVLELPGAFQSASPSSGVERTLGDLLITQLRKSLLRRNISEQRSLRLQLSIAATESAGKLDPDQRMLLSTALLRSGLPEAAEAVLATLTDVATENSSAVLKARDAALEMARYQAVRSGSAKRAEMLQRMLANWDPQETAWHIRSLSDELKSLSLDSAEQPGAAEADMLKALPESVQGLWKEAPDSPWATAWKADVSDDRTIIGETGSQGFTPWQPVPIFGDESLYSGWNLALVNPGNRLAAYDPDGQLRWTFQPNWQISSAAIGYRLNSWAFACGRLLVLHLQGVVVVLDVSTATDRTSPQLLWRMNPDKSSGVNLREGPRDFVQPEERIEQYQLLPGGHFPIGPVSEFGVPIISGRQLSMLNLFTGDRLWSLDMVPADARLLLDGDRLLVLSDAARQTEVRSAIDGTLLETHRLPEWWGEAGSNIGFSVADLELEQGSETVWRVRAEGRECVLFWITEGASRLESRDLLSDKVLWQIKLPERTVVSNLAGDVVALLSEGRQLKIVDLRNGSVRIEKDVTPVAQPRKLYLRSSHGMYVVLPEALSEEDPSLDFFNPLIDAVHIHGRIYGIRQDSGELAWEHAVKHRQLRLEHCTQTRPLLSVFPLLVLLTREREPGFNRFSVVVGTEVLDVRNGKVLHADSNAGQTQNRIWLSSPVSGELLLSFDNRVVRFTGTEAEAAAEAEKK